MESSILGEVTNTEKDRMKTKTVVVSIAGVATAAFAVAVVCAIVTKDNAWFNAAIISMALAGGSIVIAYFCPPKTQWKA